MNQNKIDAAEIKIMNAINDLDYDEKLEILFIVRCNIINEMKR